jgi:Na+/glutamate symporter
MGIIVMCIGSVISSLISLVINTYYTGKLIGVGFFMQMRDLVPTFFLSLFMGAVVYLTVTYVELPNVARLILGVIEGAILYVGLAKLLRFSELGDALEALSKSK